MNRHLYIIQDTLRSSTAKGQRNAIHVYCACGPVDLHQLNLFIELTGPVSVF